MDRSDNPRRAGYPATVKSVAKRLFSALARLTATVSRLQAAE
jgi:hypothetical protein